MAYLWSFLVVLIVILSAYFMKIIRKLLSRVAPRDPAHKGKKKQQLAALQQQLDEHIAHYNKEKEDAKYLDYFI